MMEEVSSGRERTEEAPAFKSWVRVSSRRVVLRAPMIKPAPDVASCSAAALPMPDVAPVIRTVQLDKSSRGVHGGRTGFLFSW